MNPFYMMLLLAFQGGSDTVIEERFKVEFVLLDVVAQDRKGRMVTDLTEKDFEVIENKEKVDITFFEKLDFREQIAGAKKGESEEIEVEFADGNTPVSRARPVQQIILAMDFESVVPLEINKAFAQIHQFLDSLDSDFRYEINLYSLDRGSLTKGFTDQIQDVKSALSIYKDRFSKYRNRQTSFDRDNPLLGGNSGGNGMNLGGFQGGGARSGRSSMLVGDVNDFVDLEEALSDCLQLGGSRGEVCRCLSDTAATYMEEQKLRTERVIGELEILAYKFDESVNMKTMMLVSPGFALDRINSVSQLVNYFSRASGRCDASESVSPLAGRIYIDANFDRVAHACIKNRVVFHTFDVFNTNKAQLRSFSAAHNGPPAGQIRQAYWDYGKEITQGLKELAHESGGTFKQVFRLDGAMTKTLEQNRYFYVLGYNSPKGKGGEFRKIKVKVKRRGVKLRHRRGYFGS